jgi:thiamine biosynthesis protein ThiI
MKAVCLISGGIDSPVGAQIAINKGFQPLLVHFHNFPFHSHGTLEKVIAISNRLAERNRDVSLSLSIVNHGKTQKAILNNLVDQEIRQTCIFCRIQMFYKAQEFAVQQKAEAIITGEIMGEQASQTLDNLPIVTSKTSNILVLRPLIGYNKEEVVKLSKEWGYYELSILPGGCCSINPEYPETRGKTEVIDPIYDRIKKNLEVISELELEETFEFQLPVETEDVVNFVPV